jgi:hypothetical protein
MGGVATARRGVMSEGVGWMREDHLRFSIIVPTYNEAAYLARALHSLKLTLGGDELDLLRRLRRRGPVSWERRDVVITSARRLERGLLYNFFVTFVIYYLLAYLLNRMSQPQRFGMAPAFRQERQRPLAPVWARRRVALGVVLVGLTSLGFATGASDAAMDGLANFWYYP